MQSGKPSQSTSLKENVERFLRRFFNSQLHAKPEILAGELSRGVAHDLLAVSTTGGQIRLEVKSEKRKSSKK